MIGTHLDASLAIIPHISDTVKYLTEFSSCDSMRTSDVRGYRMDEYAANAGALQRMYLYGEYFDEDEDFLM